MKNNLTTQLDLVREAARQQQEIDRRYERQYRDIIMAYTLSKASEIFLSRAHSTMPKENNLSKLTAQIEELANNFEEMQVPVDGAFYHFEGSHAYDSIRNNSFDIARLVQMYYDRCIEDDKAAESIERAFRRLPSHGIFSEKEIDIRLQEE